MPPCYSFFLSFFLAFFLSLSLSLPPCDFSRVRTSSTVKVTRITGPGVDTSKNKLPFMHRESSSIKEGNHLGTKSQNANEIDEVDRVSSFTVPRVSADATFNVELQFVKDKMSLGGGSRMLQGQALFQVTTIYTDSNNRRWMNVCNRAFETTLDNAKILRSLRFLGVLNSVALEAQMLAEMVDCSSEKHVESLVETNVEKARLGIRHRAGIFLQRFQNNANASHIIKDLPRACLGLEKSPCFSPSVIERVRSTYLDFLSRGEGWVAKIAMPILICLSDVIGTNEEMTGGSSHHQSQHACECFPDDLVALSLALTKESMDMDKCYCLCDGIILRVLKRPGCSDDDLAACLASPFLTRLLSFCCEDTSIEVVEESDRGINAKNKDSAKIKAFYSRLIEDRGDWMGGSFTLTDYENLLSGANGNGGGNFGARGGFNSGYNRAHAVVGQSLPPPPPPM